jgi:hypothetical protein
VGQESRKVVETRSERLVGVVEVVHDMARMANLPSYTYKRLWFSCQFPERKPDHYTLWVKGCGPCWFHMEAAHRTGWFDDAVALDKFTDDGIHLNVKKKFALQTYEDWMTLEDDHDSNNTPPLTGD